jgi:hypothetical protein
MTTGISTKDLQKARRNAERKRSSVACAPCKAGKTKCSDYRPCKKCKVLNVIGRCVNVDFKARQSEDISSSVIPSDTRVKEHCMDEIPWVMPARFNLTVSDRNNIVGDVHALPRQAFGMEVSEPDIAHDLLRTNPSNPIVNRLQSQPIQYTHGFRDHRTVPLPTYPPTLPPDVTSSFLILPQIVPLLPREVMEPRPIFPPPAVLAPVFGWAPARLAPTSIDLLLALRAASATPQLTFASPVASLLQFSRR